MGANINRGVGRIQVNANESGTFLKDHEHAMSIIVHMHFLSVTVPTDFIWFETFYQQN